MKSLLKNLCRALATAAVLAGGTSVFAQIADNYHEDFTTTTYRDDVLTTAVWSTIEGEIRLEPFSLNALGGYDTAGNAYDVAISGRYAFVADYTNGLVVLDISDPEAVTLAGSYNTPGNATGVEVDGDVCYLADGSAGLQIFDVSDPTAPSLIGNINPAGSPRDLVLDGDLAYLAAYTGGVHVVDVADPTAPFLLGSFSGTSTAMGLDIEGDLLYVSNYLADVMVLDVSDPAGITQVGSYNTPGHNYNLTVEGNRAYVADGTAGLRVLDVSDPTLPTLIGFADTGGSARGVTVDGDYAFVADFNDGIVLLDVSDPSNIEFISADFASIQAHQVHVVGDLAYVANSSGGMNIFPASEPIDLTSLGTFPGNGYREMDIEGDVAYVPAGSWGLYSLDITDPLNPSVLGQFWVPGISWQSNTVEVVGDFAYLADMNRGFFVLDVSDPTNMTQVFNDPVPTYDVDVAGDLAVLARNTAGFAAYNIGDPTGPTFVSSVVIPGGYCQSVTINGNYVYFAVGTQGVHVEEFNVNFFTFSHVTTISSSYATDVVVNGDFAYIADYSDGINIIDISDPWVPVLVTTFATASQPLALEVSGSDMFVAEAGHGLERLDISNPAFPWAKDAYDTGYSCYGLGVHGDYLFMCNSSFGIETIGIRQRHFSQSANRAYSEVFTTSPATIMQARISSTQVDNVDWALTTNGGLEWESVPTDGSWHAFMYPGNQLQWQALLSVETPRVNPTASDLLVEWLYDIPFISAVEDVPGDQGRQVHLTWSRSGYDFLPSSQPIVDYSVFRRLDEAAATSAEPASDKAYPPGNWQFVATVPADAEDFYSVVVPTLGDSTITGGEYLSTFFVRARTAVVGVYYDAVPVSGYSVDNLAPSVPSGLGMQAADLLAWDEASDPDFRYFTVYGSTTPDMEGALVVIGHTSDTSLDISGQSSFYFLLTATDFAGNESDAAVLDMVSNVPGSGRGRNALLGNHPNPFNPSTIISFELAAEGPVRLTLFDVAGHVVRTLLDGEVRAAGLQDVHWDGKNTTGRPAAAGVYMYRLEAGDFSGTGRMTLVK